MSVIPLRLIPLRNALVALILALCVRFAVPFPGHAQVLPAGPQVLTFYSDVDDTEQPYGLYLPPDFDASRRYPLVISLHGAGSNHRLNLKRVFGKTNIGDETDVEASRYFPDWEDRDYIVASPYARGTMGYQGIAEKDVLDVLEDVKQRFPIDEDRVYLTGLSMGGGGTLWLGLTRPDLWAAIAPVCPAPPSGTDALAGNALNLPVHIHHGSADPVVSAEGVRAWVSRFEDLGTDVGYTEYPGVGHDSWTNAYAEGQIFDWFSQHVRDRFPERVRFRSADYDYNKAYWVTLDALTPGTLGSIDAAFTGPNALEVTTEELDGFTLQLEGHGRYRADEAVTVEVDGLPFTVRGPVLSFRRTHEGWEAERYVHAPDAKQRGAQGPAGEVVSARHVYVYGTADNPSDQELAARRQRAEAAANWSVYRGPFLGRVMVFPRVLADRELRPSDLESAHLVLFGTRETNRIVADLADRLPMHLNADATEHGLVYVYPVDGRYVLINSGVPWWEQQQGSGSFFSMQIPGMLLMGMEDFLLFRRGDNAPLASGRFDRSWRLSEGDVDHIQGLGVVEVNGN